MSCQVDVRSGDVSCSAPEGTFSGGVSKAIIGDQGLHVQLESSNVRYDDDSSVFSADISVRNLLNQALGTEDGFAPDVDGVRIFFHSGPHVTAGSGTVTVKNPDGTADFTGTAQPYFQYMQAISPGGRSLPRRWEWNVPETVEGFSFLVGVSAKVADEAAIDPGIKFTVQRIAADTQHTCALDLSGQAYCWGNGGTGRLGNGGTSGQSVPGPVEGGIRFASIITGHVHTCGIATDGQGYCWGSNGDNRLGHGGTGARYEPDLIAGDYRWTQLSAGSSNTCGVTVDGEGYCWGFPSTRLGLGYTPTQSVGTPTRVADPDGSEPLKWTMILAAHLSTCGLTTDGVVYCWGPDQPGRLGLGDIGGSFNRPTTPIASSERFVYLSGKEQHFCAVTAAGDAYCWGLNTSGELGNGTSGDTIPTPTLVSGGHKFAQIQVSRSFTCGLTFDGDAYCWGLADDGRLGNGATSGIYPEPVLVQGGHKFQQISTGHRHVCGMTMDGTIYCWGWGGVNQLGNGSTDDQILPTPVPGLGAVAWLNTLPAAGCADGASRATCFPARSALESYASAGWNAVPRRVDLAWSPAGFLVGA